MTRRWLLALTLAGLLTFGATCSSAQGSEEKAATEQGSEMPHQAMWKLINTAIFFALLGWGISRSAPKFFNARSADIQKAIREATGLKMEADLRYSEIDRKMATLPDEVKKLREQAAAALERHRRRIEEDTQREIERIQHSAQAEIAGLRHDATLRIQRQTAQRALELAEKDLAARAVTEQDVFIRNFVQVVGGAQ